MKQKTDFQTFISYFKPHRRLFYRPDATVCLSYGSNIPANLLSVAPPDRFRYVDAPVTLQKETKSLPKLSSARTFSTLASVVAP